jgi:short-subunit dehydrogenase
LLDRLAERIAAEGRTKPVVTACDVARDGDVERAVRAAVERWGRLDVVVANAGFAVSGPFAALALEDYRRQFETNVFGVLRTIYAALPELEKSRGNLVLVSSVAGWVATPGISAYAMSKFAVRALAESIASELEARGITLTLISPGFVVSNIRRVDNQARFRPDAEDDIPSWLSMSTSKAVRHILRATARGKREHIITLHGRLLVMLERFQPWITRAIARRFVRRYRQRRASTSR